MSDDRQSAERGFRGEWLLAGAMAAALVCTCLQWRQFHSVRDTVSTASAQLAEMRTDAAAIRSLRQVPKTASDRARTSQELLGVVEQSLRAANIDRANWQDSVPQPPRQLPNTPYRRATTRLYLDRLTLRQLAALTFDLQRRDETLSITAVDVSRQAREEGTYNVELAVSYLIYAPG